MLTGRNKPRKKRSILWSLEDRVLAGIIKRHNSLSGVLKYLGLKPAGGSYVALKRILEARNIDFSHITLGLGSNKGKKRYSPLFPLERMLTENSKYSGWVLKKRLVSDEILKDLCVLCGQGPRWNKKPLVLQLDHINGKHNDNRLENLRVLCPNCHTQTETFSTKRFKKERPEKTEKTYKFRPQPRRRKFDVSKEELEKLVWAMPTTKVAEIFNVTDKAISRRCGLLGIRKPDRGYWTKQKSKMRD